MSECFINGGKNDHPLLAWKSLHHTTVYWAASWTKVLTIDVSSINYGNISCYVYTGTDINEIVITEIDKVYVCPISGYEVTWYFRIVKNGSNLELQQYGSSTAFNTTPIVVFLVW